MKIYIGGIVASLAFLLLGTTLAYPNEYPLLLRLSGIVILVLGLRIATVSFYEG